LTWYGKQIFTLDGNEFFTSVGKKIFPSPGKQKFTWWVIGDGCGRAVIGKVISSIKYYQLRDGRMGVCLRGKGEGWNVLPPESALSGPVCWGERPTSGFIPDLFRGRKFVQQPSDGASRHPGFLRDTTDIVVVPAQLPASGYIFFTGLALPSGITGIPKNFQSPDRISSVNAADTPRHPVWPEQETVYH